MKAVVNFGHGLKNTGLYDPGAVGPTGYQEAIQNSEIGKLVSEKLRKNGWDILTIQDGDLADITNQSNAYKPDYFLSIHANSSSSPEAKGIETYALAAGGMGEKIAKEIQKELILVTGLQDRGVKYANFWVLKQTIGYPAVLIELGFISNLKEETLMKSTNWDQIVSSAICKGFSRATNTYYLEPSTVDLKGVWIVQAGAFKDKVNADNLVKKLMDLGYAAYTYKKA